MNTRTHTLHKKQTTQKKAIKENNKTTYCQKRKATTNMNSLAYSIIRHFR
jgi:hypothetical protein